MDSGAWLTEAELIEAARPRRPTSGQLESWRGKALIPRPVRFPGGRSVWRYPPGTVEQLRRILYWRQHVYDLEIIRIQLWLEDFPIALDGVRYALDRFVVRWARDAARERASLRTDDDALDALGRKLARMRSRAPVPRAVRMTTAERARAYSFGVAVLLGMHDEVERRADDAFLLERMLGLRSGQGGGLAAGLPPGGALDGLTELPSSEEIRRVIGAAHEGQFQLARRTAGFLPIWGPALVTHIAAEEGPTAEPFAKLVRHMFSEFEAAATAFVVVVLLVRFHAAAPSETDLPELLAALEPGAMDLSILGLLPESSRRSMFRSLPERRKALARAELRARISGA